MEPHLQPSHACHPRRGLISIPFPGVLLLTFFLLASVCGCKKSAAPGADSPGASPTGASANASASASSSTAGAAGNAAPSGSLADRLNAVHDEGSSAKSAPIVLPDWKPVSAATSSMAIPLVEGLVQTGVITDQYGDHESVRTIKNVTSKTMDFVLNNELVLRDESTGKIVSGDKNSTQPPKRGSGTRVIDVADLVNAHRLMHYFQIGKTEHFPGSIPLGASTEVINQLRAGQGSQFDFQADPTSTLAAQFQGHAQLIEVQTQWNGHFMYKCTLQRVGTTDLSFPVLVNGVRMELPVLHASCPQGGDDEAHFYFLDQPSNGLLLASVLSSLDARSQIVKIEFPVNGSGAAGKGPTAMEQALADKKKVEIYGIYFDFNSSTIKPESEAVLKQISDILHKNPDWKLSVAGHTDNIGDAGFNQGLSERRAAAVKSALVSEYKIAPDRLTTSGYGASQPIETNSTVEGRARNRRVELQRQ
ncbi:MAG TPA: OmpA family protein [Terracidiphilus sp.]|jgi:outer membrane protein OmpA-like peptidoglycan-associated protein